MMRKAAFLTALSWGMGSAEFLAEEAAVTPALRGEVSSNATTLGLSTCGGNCPSGNCPSCPCGTTTSIQSISTQCARSSLWSSTCCQCIMKNESGGNANAMNYNTNGSFDVGLWQINQVNWASCNGGAPPCGTTANLNCAIKVYQWGSNTWRLWSTCTKCGCCSSRITEAELPALPEPGAEPEAEAEAEEAAPSSGSSTGSAPPTSHGSDPLPPTTDYPAPPSHGSDPLPPSSAKAPLKAEAPASLRLKARLSKRAAKL